MSFTTTFWGNSEQKLFSDQVIWSSNYTAIVYFIRVDVKILEKISNEIENRYYIHKINNAYQFVGNVLTWNVIKVEKGFADLELVIQKSPDKKHIIFKTKNDICTCFKLASIKSDDLIKKIIKQFD
jgi:hypothetical protein